jgi:hypothetical protein
LTDRIEPVELTDQRDRSTSILRTGAGGRLMR